MNSASFMKYLNRNLANRLNLKIMIGEALWIEPIDRAVFLFILTSFTIEKRVESARRRPPYLPIFIGTSIVPTDSPSVPAALKVVPNNRSRFT